MSRSCSKDMKEASGDVKNNDRDYLERLLGCVTSLNKTVWSIIVGFCGELVKFRVVDVLNDDNGKVVTHRLLLIDKWGFLHR